MNQQGLYVPKKAYFGPNLAFFGPKNLIFTGGSKSLGTHITEKPPRDLVRIFLVGRGTKWAKNVDIWTKMPVLGQFWAKNPYFCESK